MKRKIGKNEVLAAAGILKKYKEGKSVLEKRIVSNEQWWKMRHWGEICGDSDDTAPRPASAWLFNSLANKHADAMDNIPEPSVLPRERSDEECAKQLSLLLPAILDRCGYEKLYRDGWWYKLKNGSMCQAVLWDPELEDGRGDIAVKNVDLLNLFWEPGINEIQDSANLFYVTLWDKDKLRASYPGLFDSVPGEAVSIAKYKTDDMTDDSEKAEVVDWYYKRKVNGKNLLHYCRFCGEKVIYASEDDENCAEGFYAHGRYPFVIDPLFTQEGTPCGFGYIDVMRDAQTYIDKLSQVVLEHTVQMSRKRYFIRQNSAVNEAEFADMRNRFVHVAGNLGNDDIREIKAEPLDSAVMSALSFKIDELKETSGNRDFSQGSTSGGVTAASAIAALQEAGSKLSRDMIKGTYYAFEEVCTLIIELVRQFYDSARQFRITGGYAEFDNSSMISREVSMFGVPIGEKKPVFDVVCTAAKKSPFSKAAQNELALQLFKLGFFKPEMATEALGCLDMMDFEGKESVERIIKEGAFTQGKYDENQNR